MAEIIYPELSYQIVGILFEVYNELGSGLREKTYQQAIKYLLINNKIKYSELLPVNLIFKDKIIGKYFIDFLIDDKIVLEIKANQRFTKIDVSQVYDYLKIAKKKLGILATFSIYGVKFKRIIYKI